MNTPAIHQAMRLVKYPEEMAWLCFPDSDFPEGVSDLLRLCSSPEQLIEFANNNGFEPEQLSTGLFNFIEKAILDENNSDEKILGIDKFASSQLQKFHYQLLMKIYHPDLSTRPQAKEYAAVITKAYQRLKEKDKTQNSIRFSENRRPPKSYYQASQKAEANISNTKTAIAFVSAFTIFALVALVGKVYDPANPELIAANNVLEVNLLDRSVVDGNVVDNNILESQQLIKISSVKSGDSQKDTQINQREAIQATSTKLQKLLKKLEVAYEDGNVSLIKPLLANSPDIKNQSDKELNDKLKTLFEITAERKMVLFDFNWSTSINSDAIEGKGKFLSRYKLVGEKKWLTREGTALVTAKKLNNKLKITQLILENKTIE